MMIKHRNLPRFLLRRDVDPRLQAALVALCEYAGAKISCILAEFYILLGTPAGEEQLPGLWEDFMRDLENSIYVNYVNEVTYELCRVPLKDIETYTPPSELVRNGDTLIKTTIENTWYAQQRSPLFKVEEEGMAAIAAEICSILMRAYTVRVQRSHIIKVAG
jgi:hypothetical protein